MPGIASMPDFWPMVIAFIETPIFLYYFICAPNWKVRLVAVASGVLLIFASGLYQDISINIRDGQETVWFGFPFAWFLIHAGIYHHLQWPGLIADLLIYSFLGILVARQLIARTSQQE